VASDVLAAKHHGPVTEYVHPEAPTEAIRTLDELHLKSGSLELEGRRDAGDAAADDGHGAVTVSVLYVHPAVLQSLFA
jgi:hypothetical protein